MPALPLLLRRRERRIEQRQHKSARTARNFVGLGLALSAFLGFLILGGALVYAYITSDLPPIELIPTLIEPPSGSLMQPTRIYDRSGEHLLAVLAPQDAPRTYVTTNPFDPQRVPETVRLATVALIEPDFWRSPGYQVNGLARFDEHPTIAQKLVADLLLWDEPPGLRRAIRERILAAQLVSAYGREKVLEWYLNTAWYGRYAYGIAAASRLYFGKPVAELNLAEAALLAAVNQSPAINPLDAPQAALQRQQTALDEIQRLGLFTRQEIDLARFYAIQFQPETSAPVNPAPAFTALVLAQLESRYDRARVERGGMVVLTTLDYETQSRAACAVHTQLARLADAETQPCDGSAALAPLPPGLLAPDASASAAILDPRTGQILALVGDSKSGTDSGFLTPRRPGTLLTPFIYLTGFTRGLSPATLTWDIPQADSTLINPNGSFRGPLRLRTALVNDYLIPAEQVFNGMGAALIQQTMRPFGFDIPAPTLADLLASENRYTVLDLARAYGIFAAQGTLVGYHTADGLAASTLLSVRGADGRDYADWSVPVSEQIVSSPLAYLVTDVLSDGTVLNGPKLFEIGRPSAAKFGASLDGLDTWAVGYTPQRVVAVWLGGQGLSSRPVAGLWSALMQSASRDVAPDGWSQPAGIVRLNVCDPSGLLPTDDCPVVVTEIFIDGYQPVQPDTLYRAYAINRETGYLATVYTPPQLIENRIYLRVPPEAADWAISTGVDAPPTVYDTIRPPQPNPYATITAPTMFTDLKGKIRITGSAAGDDFASYRLQYGRGLNPAAWVLIADGKDPVSDGLLAEWDTAGLSGLYALQLLVVRADNSFETATIQVTVDNDAPQIGLDFPSDGAEISLAESPKIIFQPRVVDNLFLENVEIYLDGKLLRSFTSEPFTISWNAQKGEHTIRLVARDRMGNQSEFQAKFAVK